MATPSFNGIQMFLTRKLLMIIFASHVFMPRRDNLSFIKSLQNTI